VVGSLLVPVNHSILLTLHAKDVGHSFYVPVLRIQQDFVPGLEIPVHFTATQTGKFEIVCTQLCGLGHYNMRAYLDVVSEGDYEQWLKPKRDSNKFFRASIALEFKLHSSRPKHA
jgi:cytochrome c oxidase subunit 2